MPLPTDLPTGAQALLIALATPSPQGPLGIPVLLWGRPGVGKSSFIEGLATEQLRVTTLIASIHDPTDFSGLPVLEGGRVRYAIPEWVEAFGDDEDGILFLDELSTAPPSVQAALLRVVFERRVGFRELPERVRIVAAANPPDLMIGGWELSPPLRNRFVHLNWAIPESLYIRSLTEGWNKGELPEIDRNDHRNRLPAWKVKIAGFLRLSRTALHSDPEENPYGFASPRTWDFAAALLASCDVLGYRPGSEDITAQTVLLELMAGCLGEATALPFLEYLNRLRIPDPEDILSKQEGIDLNDLDDSELYVLFYSLNNRLIAAFDRPPFLDYSLVYLSLVDKVFELGRRDVIFVSLRDLARAGWVSRLAATDDDAGRGQAMEEIAKLFSDVTFKEFVDVLA
ncbi:MoxR-like ATPase [Neolewinella xylanilytica]|uniref:MoxR-like ATPase n=1 Tax=Neolewinella xylanilytica TaxID=1514080 RepID=A0A2S6I5C5_9BACT|nr:MoxR family ATPase [Neolewinella xylanilytica]PPK86368.1 MoxR-like ATPase [Neolewinella xylanilytica]